MPEQESDGPNFQPPQPRQDTTIHARASGLIGPAQLPGGLPGWADQLESSTQFLEDQLAAYRRDADSVDSRFRAEAAHAESEKLREALLERVEGHLRKVLSDTERRLTELRTKLASADSSIRIADEQVGPALAFFERLEPTARLEIVNAFAVAGDPSPIAMLNSIASFHRLALIAPDDLARAVQYFRASKHPEVIASIRAASLFVGTVRSNALTAMTSLSLGVGKQARHGVAAELQQLAQGIAEQHPEPALEIRDLDIVLARHGFRKRGKAA